MYRMGRGSVPYMIRETYTQETGDFIFWFRFNFSLTLHASERKYQKNGPTTADGSWILSMMLFSMFFQPRLKRCMDQLDFV